ncbi:MAG: protein-glutamate O-methyltransferase CheR [Thiobacillus sp.]|nr:protein-glutamate O-methyltransferase CheR [Thiobacillus sp.]
MSNLTITDQEFSQLRRILYQNAGINLSDAKKVLVIGRLDKRLRSCGHSNFTTYLRKIAAGDESELRIMVDLLTTNETYFFREHKHFDFLRQQVQFRPNQKAPFAVWSAACSSGEEPYTLAMVLMDALGPAVQWDILASDISTRILERAQTGHYAMERAKNIPPDMLSKYCLKGVREQHGTFLMAREIRDRVRFRYLNLIEPLPNNIGPFDFIFLRNVMIYFDVETKRKVVSSLLKKLRSGGHLLVGHSENLAGIADELIGVRPAIYRKP